MGDDLFDWPISRVERLVENAKRVADRLGKSHDEAPLVLGFVGVAKPSDAAVERGRELAREHGWLTDYGWTWEADDAR